MIRAAAEKEFSLWLTTQTNARGLPYKAHVANRYAACLRTEPLKLDIPLSTEERDTYRCRTLQDFDRLIKLFRTAPNFQKVDRGSGHGTFSAGLSAYRRYVCFLESGVEEVFPSTIDTPEILISNENCYNLSKQLDVTIPDVILDVLRSTYSGGFRFEATSISLLAGISGIQIDTKIKENLENSMFGRRDGIFFLPDQIADEDSQTDLLVTTDAYLQNYGCFEVSEVYKEFEKRLNPACIKTVEDFEDYYLWVAQEKVRCVAVPQIRSRVVRYSDGNVWETFGKVAKKIVTFINEGHYGSCAEDELQEKFPAFSKYLLSKIVRHCAPDELVRVEINDTICYQSFVALGLPEDFPEILSATLERLDEIELPVSQETLHTALSLQLGVNFKSEFSLPDWDTYRRLISSYYKGEPHREWKNNTFVEVDG